MTDQTRRDRSSSARQSTAIARHGRQKRSAAWKSVLGFIGGAVAVLLVSGIAVAGVAAYQLNSSLKGDVVAIEADTEAPPPTLAGYQGGFNILIVGSDTREGQHGIGGDTSGTLNDVNMLLHVAQDQKSATLVSFPRDMVVPFPACKYTGGATGLPFNTALSYGGLDCVVNVVQNLTGLKVQFAGLITFTGVISMSNAVGGVPVCVSGPMRDTDTGLNLPKAGTYVLKGLEALEFLRSRHGVGDGSDLSRISSQQVYLSSLVRTIKGNGTLDDPVKLYSIAAAAVRNMQLSKNFAQLDTLVSIALVLKNMPLQNITMVQYPGRTGGTGIFAGKVQPVTDVANQLMAAIKADKPIKIDPSQIGFHEGSVPGHAPKPTATATPTPGATPTPTATLPGATTDTGPKGVTIPGVTGQTAAQYSCSQPYQF